jgi:hypothetical protein
MTKRIIAFILLLLASAVNLWTDFPVVKTVLIEGIDYRFDSWNFFYWIFLTPIWMILYILAILLIIFALRNNKRHKLIILFPLYILIVKLINSGIGMENTRRFNCSLLLSYSTSCVLFLLALFGIIFHLIRNKDFPAALPPLKYNRKTGLL